MEAARLSRSDLLWTFVFSHFSFDFFNFYSWKCFHLLTSPLMRSREKNERTKGISTWWIHGAWSRGLKIHSSFTDQGLARFFHFSSICDFFMCWKQKAVEPRVEHSGTINCADYESTSGFASKYARSFTRIFKWIRLVVFLSSTNEFFCFLLHSRKGLSVEGTQLSRPASPRPGLWQVDSRHLWEGEFWFFLKFELPPLFGDFCTEN